MNRERSKWMSIAVIFIVLAIYNVVVFAIPFTREAGFWIGYGFSMLALLLTAGVEYFMFDRVSLKSRFYGWPLRTVAWRYLIIQLIVGLLQMILQFAPISHRYGIVVNIILFGACLIGLIGVSAAKEEIERIDEKVKEKVFYIQSLKGDVDGLVLKATDEIVKKALKELVETFADSDPMSSPQLATIENRIESKVGILCDTTDVDSIKALCEELQQMIAERNRKCRMLK
jgi:hypothetical protein